MTAPIFRLLTSAAAAGCFLWLPGGAFAQAQSAPSDCRLLGGGEESRTLIAVDGQAEPYRLACRNGRLTAVQTAPAPEAPLGGTHGQMAQPSAPSAALAKEAPPAPADAGPEALASAHNVAGVNGQEPAVSVVEAVAQAPGAGAHGEPFSVMSGAGSTLKPSITAAAAAPNGLAGAEGAAKDPSRIEASRTGPDARSADTTNLAAVPPRASEAARLALPDVVFTSVFLSRTTNAVLYHLAGRTAAGRRASVTVDPSGHVRMVDREVQLADVPRDVAGMAEALLPGARIDRVMQSTQANFRSFYRFRGRLARDEPFEIEVRSDARSLRFLTPR